MVESQSKTPIIASSPQVSVSFNPITRDFKAIANGPNQFFALLFITILMVLLFFSTSVSAFFRYPALVVLLIFFGAIVFSNVFPRQTITKTNQTLNLKGFSRENMTPELIKEAIVYFLLNPKPLQLPEPDGKYDATTAKEIPFKPDEKEKVVKAQEQTLKEVVEEIEEITGTANT